MSEGFPSIEVGLDTAIVCRSRFITCYFFITLHFVPSCPTHLKADLFLLGARSVYGIWKKKQQLNRNDNSLFRLPAAFARTVRLLSRKEITEVFGGLPRNQPPLFFLLWHAAKCSLNTLFLFFFFFIEKRANASLSR